jgi:hypothetical protein
MASTTAKNALNQQKQTRDLLTLSKRIEEVLHDRFEIVADRMRKGTMEPGELDRTIDETRDLIVLPVATYVRRSLLHR